MKIKLNEKIIFPIIDFSNCKNIYKKNEKFISNKDNNNINENNKIEENINKFNILK